MTPKVRRSVRCQRTPRSCQVSKVAGHLSHVGSWDPRSSAWLQLTPSLLPGRGSTQGRGGGAFNLPAGRGPPSSFSSFVPVRRFLPQRPPLAAALSLKVEKATCKITTVAGTAFLSDELAHQSATFVNRDTMATTGRSRHERDSGLAEEP